MVERVQPGDYLQRPLDCLPKFVAAVEIEPGSPSGTNIEAHHGNDLVQFGCVLLYIGCGTQHAEFLAIEKHKTDRTLWRQPELFERLHQVNQHDAVDAVVFCTCSEVPSVQV